MLYIYNNIIDELSEVEHKYYERIRNMYKIIMFQYSTKKKK